MKKPLLLAVLMPLALCAARAEERAPELPDLQTFREMLRSQPAPESPAGAVATVEAEEGTQPGEPSCPAPDFPEGTEIQGRAFSWRTAYDIKAGGKSLGTLVGAKGGYAYKDAGGAVVAQTSEKSVKDGYRIAVNDCVGRKIGEIVEKDAVWGGDRSFEILDAQGRTVASSGEIGYLQRRIVLTDPQGGLAAELAKNHWLMDRWAVKVRSPALDSRLVAMILAYDSEADSRESNERRRERDWDRPERPDPRDR